MTRVSSSLPFRRAKLREDVSKLKAAAVSDLASIVAEKNTLKTERDQAVAEIEAVKSRVGLARLSTRFLLGRAS
jgi:hypothetical protein